MGGGDKTGHHTIAKLRVTAGFLGDIELEFSDGLNCLIGARGTGKTTVLELIRYTLGLMPDHRSDNARFRQIESLVKENLKGGRILVDVRTKTGIRYTAERGFADAIQVTDETATAVPVQLDREIDADVFSQSQIEEIALDSRAQLGLLDRFVEVEASEIAIELDRLSRQIGGTTIDLRQFDTEIIDLTSRAAEVPVLEAKLKALVQTDGPAGEKTSAAHTAKTSRDREAKIPSQLLQSTQQVTGAISAAIQLHRTAVATQLDTTVRSGINAETFTALDADMQEFERALTTASVIIVEAGGTVASAIQRHRDVLNTHHAAQEAEYRKLLAESEAEGSRAAERSALQASCTAAVDAAKLKVEKEAERTLVATKRAELLARVSELRDRRYSARVRVAERLTAQVPTIRVTISQGGDSGRYGELVADALRGSGLQRKAAADRLTEVFVPSELALVVRSNDLAKLSEKASFDEDRGRKIVDALSDVVYELEAIDLDDVPCIELLDGGTYKHSGNLSTGQRCTTILPILLVQSERPLLIDQPEDNLDNKFIYSTVVKALKEAQGKRQVIFATHNPNIPVLGEADRIFVLESDGERATVRQKGTVDECKGEIESILEGGPEAFLERKRRYGH